MTAGEVLLLLFAVAFVVALIWFGPLITIWSVNTLFGLAIPYTLKTWFATLWLVGAAGLSTASRGIKHD